MATEQNRNDNPSQNPPDYEKLTRRQPEGSNEEQGTSNIGGRNPGQPQTSMGERDARGQRDPIGDPSADPMSSRMPDKVQQQKERNKQDQDKDQSTKTKQPYTPL